MKSSISSKLQWNFAGLCEGISPDSMRRLFSDRWTREAHLPKEYTKNPPVHGGHVRMKIELLQLNKSTKYTVCATNSYPSRYLCANVSHKEAKQIVKKWAATYLYLDESEQIINWIEEQAA